jgi:hypothetical protein
MADKKISALNPSTTPLTGVEVLPIVQSGSTVKVSVADLTAGRTVSMSLLGVGTSAPVAKLSVLTGSNYAATFNTTTASSSSTAISIGGYTTTGGGAGGSVGIRSYHNHSDTGGSSMAFEVNGSSEAMRINSSGNVGIGTSTPGYRLQVNSATENGAYITDGTRAISLINSAVAGGAVMGSFTNHPLLITTNNTERMRIDTSGNLLVGTTIGEGNGKIISVSTVTNNPCYVARNTAGAGSFYHYFVDAGNTAIIGSISNNGNTGVLYNIVSDARLKHDIVDAPEASSIIDALQVRSFKWNADNSEHRYGFIAQELADVAPEAVSQPADPDATMGVDYSKLVPMLVKELQSLRARVAELEGN